MNNLIKHFTYKPIVKRRLIGEETIKTDFISKIDEEIKEVLEAYTFKESLSTHEAEEVMDVIFVCLNMLIHYKFSVLKIFRKVYIKNIYRAKKES